MNKFTNKEHTTATFNNSNGNITDLIRLGYMTEADLETIEDFETTTDLLNKSISKLKPLRKQYQKTGFSFGGHDNIIADRDAQQDISAILSQYEFSIKPNSQATIYKVKDGVYLELTNKQAVKDFAIAIGQHTEKCFLVEGQIFAELQAQNDLDIEARFAELMA